MQVLQKRLNILNHNNVIQETISSQQTEEDEKQKLVEKADLMEHLILESTPKNLKSNTRNILNYLKNSQGLMHWTPKGELIYKGKNVKNSNVLDLIKSLQTPSNKPHPPGFDMFL
ncbi:hypothetical protein AVEN_155834-1 [Araneus ventricosus]|uniref:Uncharacterized protein n=1 Tax=Araneus ventricosus TaxID=182803 RepID=A0A4Y2QHB9_ARAVE|nr:hypothetical protein AVEN_155834-1 [Araneus ventricosus]